MTEAKKGGAAKVILIVVGIVCLIGIGCAVGSWLFVGDTMSQLFSGSEEFKKGLVAEFGQGAQLKVVQRTQNAQVLTIGIPDAALLEPDAIDDTADRVYRIYATAFAKGNMPFVTSIAIGRPAGSAALASVTEWEQNETSLDDLAARTGVPKPPPSQIESLGQSGR